jgi:hypothetical protein
VARPRVTRTEFTRTEFTRTEFVGAGAHRGRVRAGRAVPVCPTAQRDQGPGSALAVAEPDQ